MLQVAIATFALLVPAPTCTRRVVLRSAAAVSAVGVAAPAALADAGEFAKQGLSSRDASLGSNGISAYESMKLDNALSELAEPVASAPVELARAPWRCGRTSAVAQPRP